MERKAFSIFLSTVLRSTLLDLLDFTETRMWPTIGSRAHMSRLLESKAEENCPETQLLRVFAIIRKVAL